MKGGNKYSKEISAKLFQKFTVRECRVTPPPKKKQSWQMQKKFNCLKNDVHIYI